ncbi:HAMP domain-containing histidine kinase [Lentzea tibetensis]|uniref:histidine kinase n=1 Tax=Lentzea tibetensis TaxID=2591470 RepID=A0A563ET39_9PSEU|nr:HAMP domain-containing sensor histidine kinase [Lentzea tibetensis]TWP50849.1 HAMP domain-containing histidine kinase [Lentzea tibetensis]
MIHRLAFWRGLRPRLMAAFTVVTLLGAVAASGASYATARNTLLDDAQNEVMNPLKDEVTAYANRLELPPTQQTLNDFATSLQSYVVVVYQDERSQTGPDLASIPAELRTEMRTSSTVLFQRVVADGQPSLVVGIPVLKPGENGAASPSGVEVYTISPLVGPERAITNLAQWAWIAVALVLPLALALALLAARGVLRPVRRLGTAARALGDGKLHTRIEPIGSDELAELARTFNSAAEALEASQAASRRFVADVSHELRTPLTAMNAVTAVLDEDAQHLPPDTAVAARLVSEETRKLTRLVQDLIEISRFDEARNELVLDEWDIGTAVADSLAARGWTGVVETHLPTGVTGRVDRRRLDVIVANLVGNALRHGGPPVRVVLRPDRLEVSDRGPGISPEVLPHVFDRFYKADTARTRSEGSGLGLAIAWENARLHGGTIEAANRPEGGALFVLRLPW